MGLILNNNNINKIYYGSSEVSKVYFGTIQVYPTKSSYVPNPNITTFTRYQEFTTDNGRYLNMVKLESGDYTNADYPSITCPESVVSGANRLVRIYGRLTCPSDTDWVSYYGNTTNFTLTTSSTSAYSGNPILNLSYAYDDNKRLRKGVEKNYLELLNNKNFVVDIPAGSTSSGILLNHMYLYYQSENGEPDVNSKVVSSGLVDFANGVDGLLQIGYGDNGINKDYVEIDLVKSGIYTYTSKDDYLLNPLNVSLENSIMVANS